MLLIPSIDLRGGRCVRLLRGDFDAETRYDLEPHELLLRYRNLGATWLHIVDLDGALALLRLGDLAVALDNRSQYERCRPLRRLHHGLHRNPLRVVREPDVKFSVPADESPAEDPGIHSERVVLPTLDLDLLLPDQGDANVVGLATVADRKSYFPASHIELCRPSKT